VRGVVARVLAVVIAVGVMMVTMGGCADDATGGRGAERSERSEGPLDAEAVDAATIGRALRATREASSGRVELTTAYRNLGPGAPGLVHLVQRAVFDRESGRGEAEMDMSELAAVLDDADESVPGDYSRPTRVVIAEDTVYSQVGPLAAEIGLDPATWVTREVASLADEPIDNDTVALLVQPLGMLDLLDLPILNVRPAAEAAGGAGGAGDAGDLAQVEVTLDLAPSGTNGHAGDETVEARLRGFGLSELTADVALAADGTVRRLAFTIDAPASGSGPGSGSAESGGFTTTFELHDVGEPVDVDVPTGPDVIDQAELRDRLLGR
jgi:hypothetical protein